MLPYLNIFGIKISMYAICVLLGLTACVALVVPMIRKRKDYNKNTIIVLPLVAAVGALIGAHLVYAITRTDILTLIFQHWNVLFSSTEIFFGTMSELFGGMVFYGGLIGAIIAAAIYCKVKKIDFGLYADIYTPAIPLFHAFGRLGCFCAGCCYGIESHWGVIYHDNELMPPDALGMTRLPIQLIEAVCNLLLAALLTYLSRKKLKKGSLLGIYFVVYAVIRFTDEFFRGDTIRGLWFGLSTSQWISLGLFIVGAILLMRRYVFSSKEKFESRVDIGKIPQGYVYNRYSGAIPESDAHKIVTGEIERP